MGEVLHDVNECLKSGNLNGATRVCCCLEMGLLNSGGVVTAGTIKCETAHVRVECMDKAEMRLRSLLYEMITPLLNHNELLDHARALGAHTCRLCSSMNIAIKHSGLGQMWVELQHFLQQSTSTESLIYREVEQELRCEENKDHPKHLEEKATGGGVSSSGYVKVQSTPYAYEQGAEAKREDPESAPPSWLCFPQIWGVAGSGGISRRIIHLFCGPVKATNPAK